MVNIISFWSEQMRFYNSIMLRSKPNSKKYKEAEKDYKHAERMIKKLTEA